MGPPGAGKGTQAELLAQKIGYHRFSTGGALREMARQDTELGRKVKRTIENGFFAPPELAAEIVINAVEQYVLKQRGLVFDGTPRTEREAELVDAYFENKQYGRPLAILLDASKEDMIERNRKRRFCLNIKNDFPVVTEQDEKRCKTLGGVVGARPDDELEKQNTRWSEFTTLAMPVIEKYKKEGILQIVDGRPSVEAVHQSVTELIHKYSSA